MYRYTYSPTNRSQHYSLLLRVGMFPYNFPFREYSSSILHRSILADAYECVMRWDDSTTDGYTNPLHLQVDSTKQSFETRCHRRSVVGMVEGFITAAQGKLASINSINQYVNQTINQSINQSITHSLSQSINQSINQSITQSVSQSVSQYIHPSINPSIHQSINPSINQSINQSINPSINQSVDQSISRSINHSVSQSVSQSIHPSIHQSINQSIHQSINQSIHQSISRSINQPINRSISPSDSEFCQTVDFVSQLNQLASLTWRLPDVSFTLYTDKIMHHLSSPNIMICVGSVWPFLSQDRNVLRMFYVITVHCRSRSGCVESIN